MHSNKACDSSSLTHWPSTPGALRSGWQAVGRLLAGYGVDSSEPRRIATYHGEHGPSEARTVLAQILGEWGLGDFLAVAHRIVHGGKALTHACILDDAVKADIERLTALAPS